MAALSLRPTLTEVLKVLTPCHGATLHCVPSCTIQGTCRSLLMAGTLRVRTAEKTTLRRLRSLNVTRPESPASTAGLAHGRYACCTLRLSALVHSKLDTLWRNRCAGGASYPYRHPSFLRQRRVSAWVASPAPLDFVLGHSMPPIHEGDTHRTLKTSYAYVPTLPLCHVPDAQRWLLSL